MTKEDNPETGIKSTLDQFIQRVRKTGVRGNEWVTEDSFKYLYVRYGNRYIAGYNPGNPKINYFSDVLDIANVEVKKNLRGTGVFTRLVSRLRKTYPGMHIYVECVAPEFQSLLLRLKFVPTQPVLNESFFLKGEI